jgi:L-fucose isomerase-like protein
MEMLEMFMKMPNVVFHVAFANHGSVILHHLKKRYEDA